MLLNESKIKELVYEELSKSEVSSMIASKIDNKLSSQEFKKIVKSLATDVVSELFKILWQRNSFWKSSAASEWKINHNTLYI